MARSVQFSKKILNKFTSQKSITLWGEIVDGPYGGGSQALKAISEELKRRGYNVYNNAWHDSHAHLMSSAWFDTERAKAVILNSKHKPKVVHRIDGPISLYRGKDKDKDEIIFSLNRSVATHTAFQCYYSWVQSKKMGFDAINPCIVRNASEPEYFYPKKPQFPSGANGKFRIISSSWSTNMIKGFETYEYLDKNLDFSKFEYWFVGRSPIAFKNIQLFDAVASPKLGEYLRSADIYITASMHDPASNSLSEALTSGLPVLYIKSGGHSEIAGFSGIGFNSKEEVPILLDKLIRDYPFFQKAHYVRSIKLIVDQYLRLMGL